MTWFGSLIRHESLGTIYGLRIDEQVPGKQIRQQSESSVKQSFYENQIRPNWKIVLSPDVISSPLNWIK